MKRILMVVLLFLTVSAEAGDNERKVREVMAFAINNSLVQFYDLGLKAGGEAEVFYANFPTESWREVAAKFREHYGEPKITRDLKYLVEGSEYIQHELIWHLGDFTYLRLTNMWVKRDTVITEGLLIAHDLSDLAEKIGAKQSQRDDH